MNLQELQTHLLETCVVHASITIVWRTMKRLRYTMKIVCFIIIIGTTIMLRHGRDIHPMWVKSFTVTERRVNTYCTVMTNVSK